MVDVLVLVITSILINVIITILIVLFATKIINDFYAKFLREMEDRIDKKIKLSDKLQQNTFNKH